ncbi:MAG TPA: DUF4292 domain-containing protein [Flavisolibacter sp.]|nr:DUF4292 domain-containing protein [Flavisolibacter sp.]
MTRYFLMLIAIVVLASCRSTKKIQTAITKKDTSVTVLVPEIKRDDSTNFYRSILNEIRKNYIDYKTFSAKVNIDYRGSDGKNQNVNANIRMHKDSAIWISANALLGIEALRVLVTRDSVKVLDKLNKAYILRSVSYLQELTDLPLNLYTLQDLIIGNPVFLDSSISSYSTGNGLVSILSVGKSFKNLLTMNESDKSLVLSKLDDVEITRSRTGELGYSDYENKKGVLFATKRRIIVAEKKRLEVRLDFKQYDFNVDVSFPFSVPKNYEKQ